MLRFKLWGLVWVAPWIQGRNFSEHHMSIMVWQEYNFRHNSTIFMVTQKNIIFNFTSIMCLTLLFTAFKIILQFSESGNKISTVIICVFNDNVFTYCKGFCNKIHSLKHILSTVFLVGTDNGHKCFPWINKTSVLIESLRSTTWRQRQRHKFCIFNEAKQKLCTPFTSLFHFCTFLSRSRQICDVKWPFLKF